MVNKNEIEKKCLIARNILQSIFKNIQTINQVLYDIEKDLQE